MWLCPQFFVIVCFPPRVNPCGWTAGHGVVAFTCEHCALLDTIRLGAYIRRSLKIWYLCVIFCTVDRLSECGKVRIELRRDQFLSWAVCLLDGAVHIFTLVFLLKLSFTKWWVLHFIGENQGWISKKWLVVLQYPQSFHPSVEQLCEGFLSVWVARSEQGSWMNRTHLFEGGKPPKELVYSIRNFMVIYCHVLLWLLVGCIIGFLAGLEPETLKSAATSPALPSELHASVYAYPQFGLTIWATKVKCLLR